MTEYKEFKVSDLIRELVKFDQNAIVYTYDEDGETVKINSIDFVKDVKMSYWNEKEGVPYINRYLKSYGPGVVLY